MFIKLDGTNIPQYVEKDIQVDIKPVVVPLPVKAAAPVPKPNTPEKEIQYIEREVVRVETRK
jgi:hypothetical protein